LAVAPGFRVPGRFKFEQVAGLAMFQGSSALTAWMVIAWLLGFVTVITPSTRYLGAGEVARLLVTCTEYCAVLLLPAYTCMLLGVTVLATDQLNAPAMCVSVTVIDSWGSGRS
jgi:hypothetical protein